MIFQTYTSLPRTSIRFWSLGHLLQERPRSPISFHFIIPLRVRTFLYFFPRRLAGWGTFFVGGGDNLDNTRTARVPRVQQSEQPHNALLPYRFPLLVTGFSPVPFTPESPRHTVNRELPTERRREEKEASCPFYPSPIQARGKSNYAEILIFLDSLTSCACCSNRMELL